MITITNIRNVNYKIYDEVWAIVRSLKNPGNMLHVPELSPSWNLFKNYLEFRDSGHWNAEAFKNIYVPTFLQEMKVPEARKKLNEIVSLDRQGKRICLVCFCPDETLCHRSIIAGILQHVCVHVEGIKGDYSKYAEAISSYLNIKKNATPPAWGTGEWTGGCSDYKRRLEVSAVCLC